MRNAKFYQFQTVSKMAQGKKLLNKNKKSKTQENRSRVVRKAYFSENTLESVKGFSQETAWKDEKGTQEASKAEKG